MRSRTIICLDDSWLLLLLLFVSDVGDDQNNEAKHLKKEEYVEVAVEVLETVAECRKMWTHSLFI